MVARLPRARQPLLVRLLDSYASFHLNVSDAFDLRHRSGYCLLGCFMDRGTPQLQFTRQYGLACSLVSKGSARQTADDAPTYLYALNVTAAPSVHCDTVATCPQPQQPGHLSDCYIGQMFLMDGPARGLRAVVVE